ncbi:MAG: hypothetical protein ACLFRJ_03045 [Ectothiorhodospira sp.]
MRGLFVLLVLLNLAWLGYALLFPVPPEREIPEVSVARPGVPLLQWAEPTPDPEDVESGDGATCHRLGPFARETEAEQRLRAFRAAGVTGRVEQVTLRVPLSYWVVLPTGDGGPAPLVRRLQAAGLTDHFIIPDGPRQGDLSLGLFSSKGRAARHLARVRALGLDPILEVRFQDRVEYRLELRAPGGLVPGVLPLPVEGIRREDHPCPGT